MVDLSNSMLVRYSTYIGQLKSIFDLKLLRLFLPYHTRVKWAFGKRQKVNYIYD
jgi:hypothetical protein